MGDNSAIEWTTYTWRSIPSWPNYAVSSTGVIRNRKTWRLLKLIRRKSGHLYFYPQRGRRCYAHRAVLEAFVGPAGVGQECRHLDGNPANNSVDNLCWGSRRENAGDKQRHGTQPRGEGVATAKLTERDVQEIRSRWGRTSSRKLATFYSVSHTAIRRAAIGLQWGHVSG
jgi:hypothetical protein